MDDEDKNILPFRVFGREEEPQNDNSLPVNNFVVTNLQDEEFYVRGFLAFMPEYLAIMINGPTGKGALPALAIPHKQVKSAEMVSDEDAASLPF